MIRVSENKNKMVIVWLPFPNVKKSLKCLCDMHLGGQIREIKIIYNILTSPDAKKGYSNHPIVKSLKGYENFTAYYFNCCIEERLRRGQNCSLSLIPISGKIKAPWWWGWREFHYSHQASLIRKHPHFYTFPDLPQEFLELGYVWPISAKENLIKLLKNRITLTDNEFIYSIPGKDYFHPINPESYRNAHLSEIRTYTLPQLKETAKNNGFKTNLKKQELFDLLKEHNLI